MTARDEMAVLFERSIIGEEPGTTNYGSALRQAASELDAIARMATHPETAPTVFAWLVEAGVLAGSGVSFCTLHHGIANEDDDSCDFDDTDEPCTLHLLFHGEPRR